MGAALSAVGESYSNHQQFLLDAQKAQFERQIEYERILREREAALKIARHRDATAFTIPCLALCVVSCSAYGRRTNNLLWTTLPSFPAAFYLFWQYHMAYGNKLQMINDSAEEILRNQSDLVRCTAWLPMAATSSSSHKTVDFGDKFRDAYEKTQLVALPPEKTEEKKL